VRVATTDEEKDVTLDRFRMDPRLSCLGTNYQEIKIIVSLRDSADPFHALRIEIVPR